MRKVLLASIPEEPGERRKFIRWSISEHFLHLGAVPGTTTPSNLAMTRELQLAAASIDR